MKRTMYVLLLSSLSLPTLAALDLNPPDWRGHERSTYQYWDFSTDNQTPEPEDYKGAFQPLPAEVYPSSGSWNDELEGHTGVFPLSGDIYVPVYNFSEPLNEKIIWIQLTWLSKGWTPLVEAKADSLDIQTVIPEWTTGFLIDEQVLNDGWTHSTFKVILRPNPSQELIHIYGSIYIDDLVVDTLCIPEPATLVLMAMGSFLVFFKVHIKP